MIVTADELASFRSPRQSTLPGCDAGHFIPENRTMNDHQAMLAIQQEFDGVEWTADTLGCIAEILQQAGYRIRDPDDRETRAEDIPAGGSNSIKAAHIPGPVHFPGHPAGRRRAPADRRDPRD
jgi:hypothetical protein